MGSFFQNEPICNRLCKRHKPLYLRMIRRKVRENKLGSFRRMACFFRPFLSEWPGQSGLLPSIASSRRRKRPREGGCQRTAPDYTHSTTPCPVKLSISDSRCKGDTEKPCIAARLHQETTMTLKWIAARLKMGTWIYVSNRLARRRKLSSVNSKD